MNYHLNPDYDDRKLIGDKIDDFNDKIFPVVSKNVEFNDVHPVPPCKIAKIPLEIFEAFNVVRPLPDPLNVPFVIIGFVFNFNGIF